LEEFANRDAAKAAGYSRILFEQAFGCEVVVKLLASIKAGDERCLMKIAPCDAVWK
jgi:hypothetical protein